MSKARKLEVSVLRITRFTRTSGRDLGEVRRPRKPLPLEAQRLKKAELVALAEAQGVDSSGTKQDILEPLDG